MKPRTRRLVMALLAASLALNLFLGAWAAVYGMRRYWRDKAPPPPLTGFRTLRHLDQNDPVVSSIWAQYAEAVRTEVRALRGARRSVREALQRDPLDIVALRRALVAVEAGTLTVQRLLHEFLAAAALEMTPAQRREWADSVSLGRPARSESNDKDRGEFKQSSKPDQHGVR